MFVAYSRVACVDWSIDQHSWLSTFTCPCSAHVVPYSLFVNLAIQLLQLGFVSAAAKYGRSYTYTPTTHLFLSVFS